MYNWLSNPSSRNEQLTGCKYMRNCLVSQILSVVSFIPGKRSGLPLQKPVGGYRIFFIAFP